MLSLFRKDKIKKSDSGLYYLKVDGKKVYSSHKQILGNPLRKILIDGDYDFSTNKIKPFIIDCGSNIGLGVLFWKTKFPEAEILAFEPSREVFEALKTNVEYRNFSDVKIYQIALSNQIGEAEFNSNESLSGSLELSKGLPNIYKVKVDMLSNYLTKPVDFLKIDIEGAEIEVLKDIEEKLPLVKNIFIEYHSFIHKQQELSYIFDLLEKKGFRYYVDGEYRLSSPLLEPKVSLNQDLQISIWAKNETENN